MRLDCCLGPGWDCWRRGCCRMCFLGERRRKGATYQCLLPGALLRLLDPPPPSPSPPPSHLPHQRATREHLRHSGQLRHQPRHPPAGHTRLTSVLATTASFIALAGSEVTRALVRRRCTKRRFAGQGGWSLKDRAKRRSHNVDRGTGQERTASLRPRSRPSASSAAKGHEGAHVPILPGRVGAHVGTVGHGRGLGAGRSAHRDGRVVVRYGVGASAGGVAAATQDGGEPRWASEARDRRGSGGQARGVGGANGHAVCRRAGEDVQGGARWSSAAATAATAAAAADRLEALQQRGISGSSSCGGGAGGAAHGRRSLWRRRRTPSACSAWSTAASGWGGMTAHMP